MGMESSRRAESIRGGRWISPFLQSPSPPPALITYTALFFLPLPPIHYIILSSPPPHHHRSSTPIIHQSSVSQHLKHLFTFPVLSLSLSSGFSFWYFSARSFVRSVHTTYAIDVGIGIDRETPLCPCFHVLGYKKRKTRLCVMSPSVRYRRPFPMSKAVPLTMTCHICTLDPQKNRGPIHGFVGVDYPDLGLGSVRPPLP
ncbi:hypothetical protein BXZ70DRAFT_372504 [Cristinia sonorae]|uniref:Uncharacterized protein n=1 Tax=Cristinia sonorae TaxID=1940300 RepID=A0A8K0XMQ1_9AGAR|nr:hypothetical protein BXZ70DRAFT_372504 [Cristinia sonorae]